MLPAPIRFETRFAEMSLAALGLVRSPKKHVLYAANSGNKKTTRTNNKEGLANSGNKNKALPVRRNSTTSLFRGTLFILVTCKQGLQRRETGRAAISDSPWTPVTPSNSHEARADCQAQHYVPPQETQEKCADSLRCGKAYL